MNVYATIAVVMTLSFLAQAVAVRGYVMGLLAIAQWSALLKILAGALLWLVFAGIVVAPLFASLHISTVRQEVQGSLSALGWLMLCFLFAFVPTAAYLWRKLPVLRCAGYFRAQQGAPADVTKNALHFWRRG